MGSWTVAKVYDRFNIVIPDKIKTVVEYLGSKMSTEFAVLMKIQKESKGTVYLSEDFYIPKQKVSAAHIEIDPDDEEVHKYDCIVHRHPDGMHVFSTTDEENINLNFVCSLLWTVPCHFVHGIYNIFHKNGVIVRLPFNVSDHKKSYSNSNIITYGKQNINPYYNKYNLHKSATSKIEDDEDSDNADEKNFEKFEKVLDTIHSILRYNDILEEAISKDVGEISEILRLYSYDDITSSIHAKVSKHIQNIIDIYDANDTAVFTQTTSDILELLDAWDAVNCFEEELDNDELTNRLISLETKVEDLNGQINLLHKTINVEQLTSLLKDVEFLKAINNNLDPV